MKIQMVPALLRYTRQGGEQQTITIDQAEPGWPLAFTQIVKTPDGQAFGLTNDGAVFEINGADSTYLGDHGTMICVPEVSQ